ncbi:YpdA family putative bacillithiol disulfide reductase [Runella salmonicolor]|uniref:YpdA family putative bacillithiol disulfide reductase n=1 Tax=Runella salmonicolor TaxID=2950278 RepID=A0ABT1FJD7_9BACT|nr:YpdA family putative bacillithiol disulfide reductase [Runella salmonicolor]MCP1381885.1 YpdA family putative bacillithiol disulfide reductase [Runella salmonicolor]
MQVYDVLIIGAGPCGLAVGIEAAKAGLSHLILEKGSITESIRRYPKRMRFFSTAENIEIGGIPFPISELKANRSEALQYYRKVAGYYHLNFKLFTEVTQVVKQDDLFEVQTAKGEAYHARKVIIATGYFDFPRHLGIPGENLPHVTPYYDEPFLYSFSKVVIVGAANSAVEAALELYRHDVDVTIVHRGEDFRPTVKYWLVPDVKNRVREGKIKTRFNSLTTAIEPKRVQIENVETGESEWIDADFVLMLIGYVPDGALLQRCGIELTQPSMVPVYDPETFETNVAGLYLCGTVVAGIHTEKVFIENGREHAAAIIDHIAGRKIRQVKELIERI